MLHLVDINLAVNSFKPATTHMNIKKIKIQEALFKLGFRYTCTLALLSYFPTYAYIFYIGPYTIDIVVKIGLHRGKVPNR